MKILVIGSGGREHALAWKLAQSKKVQRVYVAPGNGGTALDKRLLNVPLKVPVPGDTQGVQALRTWAQQEKIGLTVVGPEAALAAGVVDEFKAHGLRIFGPTQAAAQLESSKAYSKAFMQRHGIPTAEFDTFSDAAAAHAYVQRVGAPIVIKADGLAAGKGVVVAQTLAQAHEAIDFMLLDSSGDIKHNAGGARVVIERVLEGEEASFIVLCDGKSVLALATSQDHKRLLDADQGPNTGGMGAYSPAPVVSPAVHARAMREIILPTIRGMEKDGLPYSGFLYAGLMIDASGNPKALEFNCRLGDPETQPIMLRLKSDLVDVLLAASQGKLDQVELEWDRRIALGVVLAAHGYPHKPRKGDFISGLGPDGGLAALDPADPAASTDQPERVVFHAGTALQDGRLIVQGGRVLCVTALGDTTRQAQQRAYEALQNIQFDGMQYRRDIGARALKG